LDSKLTYKASLWIAIAATLGTFLAQQMSGNSPEYEDPILFYFLTFSVSLLVGVFAVFIINLASKK
jgi:cytochrome c biogenesis protein ResB